MVEFLGDVAAEVVAAVPDLVAAVEEAGSAGAVGLVEVDREGRLAVGQAEVADLVGRAGAGADRVAAGRVE